MSMPPTWRRIVSVTSLHLTHWLHSYTQIYRCDAGLCSIICGSLRSFWSVRCRRYWEKIIIFFSLVHLISDSFALHIVMCKMEIFFQKEGNKGEAKICENRWRLRHKTAETEWKWCALHCCVMLYMAVWQIQPMLVQTVLQHCLVWIYLDT